MKVKEYKIETLQDIINCTNESNVDNFLIDLKAFLEMNRLVQNAVALIATTDEEHKVETSKFIWIDDGNHKGTLTIKSK